MNPAEKVYVVKAHPGDIAGIVRVLDGTLGQDFRYGSFSFEENVHYSFSRSISHPNEGVYVAKQILEKPESEVVGFAWFMNHPPNNGTAILEIFAVRKDRQKQ